MSVSRIYVVLAAAVLLLSAGYRGDLQAQATSPAPLRHVRIYTDAAGDSHFANAELGLRPVDIARGIPPTPSTTAFAATDILFRCAPVGGASDWHGVPQRLFLFVVSGISEVEVSAGEVRRFGAGSVLLLEDTEGKGHRTRVIGDERLCFGTVLLEAGAPRDPSLDARTAIDERES